MATVRQRPTKELIKHNRIQAGLTLEQARLRIGVAYNTVCDWEAGNFCPTETNLAKMAEAYNCSVSDFFEIKVTDLQAVATSTLLNFLNSPKEKAYQRARVALDILRLNQNMDAWEDLKMHNLLAGADPEFGKMAILDDDDEEYEYEEDENKEDKKK